MTHTENRINLIRALLEEQPKYTGIEIPADEQEQKKLLRSAVSLPGNTGNRWKN